MIFLAQLRKAHCISAQNSLLRVMFSASIGFSVSAADAASGRTKSGEQWADHAERVMIMDGHWIVSMAIVPPAGLIT